MESELIFYVYLVLCAIAFFDVLFTARKNFLLNVCLLLIISSLFAMNYFTYAGITNRFQFVFVKLMRIIYVCSTMLAVIYLVSPRIPRWIIVLIVCSVSFLVGIRIFYFNEIDIENLSQLPNQVFSIGAEFDTPHHLIRNMVFGLVILTMGITFYYYRLLLMKIDREAPYYKYLSRWVVFMVLPLFLLTIFAVLGNLNVFQTSTSSQLFSFFSSIIIFSILFRPRFLNTTSYAEINQRRANANYPSKADKAYKMFRQ